MEIATRVHSNVHESSWRLSSIGSAAAGPCYPNNRTSASQAALRPLLIAPGNIRTFGQCASGRDLRGRGGKKPRCAGQISSALEAGLCRGGGCIAELQGQVWDGSRDGHLTADQQNKFCDTADCKSAFGLVSVLPLACEAASGEKAVL